METAANGGLLRDLCVEISRFDKRARINCKIPLLSQKENKNCL